MKLYFVRHGETAFNKEGRIMGGELDEPLDQTGIEQSEHLAEILDADFEKMYVSPLGRAQATARIINERLHLPTETRQELHERNFGSMSGKTWAEMQAETGLDLHTKDDHLQYDYTPYGGESEPEVMARLRKFVDYVKTQPEQKVLVVTHFGLIELMHKLMDNTEPTDIKNDSIHIFEI